jgi:hypothetical protein
MRKQYEQIQSEYRSTASHLLQMRRKQQKLLSRYPNFRLNLKPTSLSNQGGSEQAGSSGLEARLSEIERKLDALMSKAQKP